MKWSPVPLLFLALAAPASAAGTPAPAVAKARPVLPFIENDYPRALAEARRLDRPMFVEAWAPW